MRIAMLLSGGVDSAVALHKIVQHGHDVTPFYIRIGMDNDQGDCSAEEDIEMCRLITARYKLPLEIVSLHQEYWDNVMDYALKTVKQGLTPNPDVMCNKIIKFGFFEQRWGKDFDKTATGHYATTLLGNDNLIYLGTAPDLVKDQTDFLAQISYQQLSHIIFPIGDMPKAMVRETAVKQNLPNAYRRDSQGICFLGKINYNDFLMRQLGKKTGPIIEIETGRKLGEHNGFWFHTIGQRKGLGLSGGPWYVVGKNVNDNVVYVSGGYDTQKQYGKSLHIAEMHWITRNPMPMGETSMKISFKNRHTPEFIDATLHALPDEGEYLIESEQKVQGIAPGQFAVIYNNDRTICYGSGIITGRNTDKIYADE